MPRLIELVGPAGAGKTTLIRAIQRQHPPTVVGAEISLRKIEQLPSVLSGMTHLVPILRDLSPRFRGVTWDVLKSMIYLDAWRTYLLEKAGDSESTILLDQGPIFKLATLRTFLPDLFRHPAADEWWRDMLARWISVLDMIVWLDAPDAVLRERINSREKWHSVRDQDASVVYDFLDRYRRGYREILDHCVGARALGVMRYDTSKTPAEEIGWEVLAVSGAVGHARM